MADEKDLCPPFLYKYYICSKHNLNVLKKEKIWASDPYCFNDPFDCTSLFWDGATFPFNEIKKWLKEIVEEKQLTQCTNINQLRELFCAMILDGIGVFCLNSGDFNDLFWAHYTDNHRGFQILFNKEKLNEFWELTPFQVVYLPEKEILSQKLSLMPNEWKSSTILPKIIRWLTVKKDCWEKEKEWRYLFRYKKIGDGTRLIQYPRDAIESITLGFKFFDFASEEYLKNRIYKYEFDEKVGGSNYHLKTLKFLKQSAKFPIYQVALSENLKLYSQRIYLKEIRKNKITIERELTEDQRRVLDCSNT